MRYFFVSFVYVTYYGVTSVGNTYFESEHFPSRSKFSEETKLENNIYSLTITSIFEFKNKQDFIDFQK